MLRYATFAQLESYVHNVDSKMKHSMLFYTLIFEKSKA